MTAHVSPGGWPALVLNADFRPLSYYPLSLWSWQDAVKAVFLERVNIVEQYDKAVHSPSLEMKLPSVVSLKTFVRPSTHPAFTRFNVFLRDKFCCQFCGTRDDLTFDHLLPRSRGGHTTWINVVAACSGCNLQEGQHDAGRSAHVALADAVPAERARISIAMAGCSRRTICTTAGSTISTGIPSSIRKRAAWPARPTPPRPRAPARSARCNRPTRGRGSATPLRRSARCVARLSCSCKSLTVPKVGVPEHSCGPGHHFHSMPE